MDRSLLGKDRPLILVVNDDGYDSPGIIELASRLMDLGDVLLAAPKEHHSGVARGIPFGSKARQSGVIEEHLVEVSPGVNLMTYAIHGTPAQCVVHAVMEIAPRKPDICISGINFGANIGRALNYSGTVGAAIEAADFGIPSIATSQELDWEDVFNASAQRKAFEVSAQIAAKFARKILENKPQEKFYCINLNFPHGVQLDTEVEVTSQADINRWGWVKPKSRDFSQHYSLEYDDLDGDWVPGTDAHAVLVNKNVSITPIGWSIEARDGEYDRTAIEKLTISE